MNILGISAFYHDSASALIQNNLIIAAAQEERFTRHKHDQSFPANSIRYCLETGGVSINELDAIVFYEKPFLKFERLLESYYAFAPKGIASFINAIPVWLNEKLFLKRTIHRELKKISLFDRKKLRILFPEHHLSHASSAFYPSPFARSAILTIDAVGEWATASIARGYGNKIDIIKELHYPHSAGLLYSAFTYFLGFTVNSGEYKLMGLAPYGNKDSLSVSKFIDIIKTSLVQIYDDGSLWLNPDYFTYSTSLFMISDKKWEKLFGFPVRHPETNIEQHHCDLAYAIQSVTDDIVLNMAKEALKLTGEKNICLAGGVALNCVSNGKLLESGLFENIFVQPASGDAGGALGACLTANYIYFNNERITDEIHDGMNGAFLGPEYVDSDIEQVSKKYRAICSHFQSVDELTATVADHIISGNIIGWFRGRMEFGPRALGNRSIIADPRNPEIQKKLNLKIKFREGFRPFAPSVIAEDCSEYFEINCPSPYMLLVAGVKNERRNDLPPGYDKLNLMDKLYFRRSDIPSVTHIDYSSRVQTVHSETNPVFHKLISKFKEKTGYGLIVNTSFNVRGEPIVCNPDHAYRCFMRTDMDFLVMGNYLYSKAEQPMNNDRSIWEEKFKND